MIVIILCIQTNTIIYSHIKILIDTRLKFFLEVMSVKGSEGIRVDRWTDSYR